MKQKLLYLLALCWLLPAMATYADNEGRNVLIVPQWVLEPWHETSIPICIENTCDTATAIQFTLMMPEDVEVTLKAGEMTDRLPHHQLNVHKEKDTNSWTVMVHSDHNTLIEDSWGAVFYLKCTVTHTNGRPSLPIFISDAVLSDNKGNNVLTDVVASPPDIIIFTSLMCKPSFGTHSMEKGRTANGSFKLINHSSYSLTGLTVTPAEESEWCDFSITPEQDYIDDGKEITVNYELTGKETTPFNRWQRMKLNINTAEGVTAEFFVYYYVKEPVALLRAENVPIHVSIPIAASEPMSYMVLLKNVGAAETGPISVVTDGTPIKLADGGNTLESIPAGGEAEMRLKITLPPNAQPDQVFDGHFGVNPANGDGIAICYQVTAVEDRKGKITIYTVDDLGKVSGAHVKLQNTRTEAMVKEGDTDENGKVAFNDVRGGQYNILVTAPRHKDAKVVTTVSIAEDNEAKVRLEFANVNTKYEVSRDTVNHTENLTIESDVETNILAPSIDIDLPNSKPQPQALFPITVKNKNTTTAFNLDFGLGTSATCGVEFWKDPHIEKLEGGEEIVLFARLVANDLPNVLELTCTCEYIYGLNGTTKTGTAFSKRIYGSTSTSYGGGSDSYGGYAGSGPLGNPEHAKGIVGSYGNVPYTIALKGSNGEPTTSTVKMELGQRLKMTREAFLGTLTVTNEDVVDLKDVKLDLTIMNHATGIMATEAEFYINLQTLEVFSGTKELGAPWSLAAGSEGTAEIRFVPTDQAAPEGPVDYVFGGKLHYRFADMQQPLTIELMPVTLTVNPTPRLFLDYFLQPDVMGDDLLTPDVEEPQEPAELSLIINNRGRGSTPLTLETMQPTIKDNVDGVPIIIEIAEAWKDGEQEDTEMTIDFGILQPDATVFAGWLLKSNLMALFSNYEVEVQSQYPSLIEQAQVHELVMKSFDVGDGRRGFLANDDKDDDHWPETLYFSDGTTAPVAIGQAMIYENSANEYYIDLSSPSDGWVYWRIDAPVADGDVTSVVRDDDNYEVWWQQNYRVYKDEDDGLLKYKREVHIIDHPGIGTWGYWIQLDPVTTSVDSQCLTGNDGWTLGRLTADGCLMLKGNWEQVTSLWVVDGAGRQRQVVGNKEKGVEVAHLLPGVYILKIVTTDGSIVAKKFVKAN